MARWILLRNPGNPVCGSHHAGSQPAEATRTEAVESTSIFRLTKLPPLTYPLIVEELRPEVTLSGAFVSAHPPGMVPPRPCLYAGGRSAAFR